MQILSSITTSFPRSLRNKTGWLWTEGSPPLPEKMPDGSPWPRISVVTPSYNQGQFIEETVRSVLLQGYSNLEYIVMDGGSNDGTVEILERYRPFFSHYQSGRDGGQAAAIGKGFERATGEILAWLNSDDIYLPGALERVALHFVTHPNDVFVDGDVTEIDVNSRPIGMFLTARPWLFMTKISGKHRWRQPGSFWTRRAYVESGGIDPSFRFTMDSDLFIRICSLGKSGRIPGKPLAGFRTHSEQKTATIMDICLQEEELLKKRYEHPFWSYHPSLLRLCWVTWVFVNRPAIAVDRLKRRWNLIRRGGF